MIHPKVKLFFYILMGLTVVLYCLYLLPATRLSLPADFLCSAIPEMKNYTSAANTVPLSLLHSSVTRGLMNGHLPLDAKDNRSWSIFQKDSREYPCSQYKTRFGVYMPRVWLVSFPRSGNAWTRYLLEAASGIFTGSVYHDKELYDADIQLHSSPQPRQPLLKLTSVILALFLAPQPSFFMGYLGDGDNLQKQRTLVQKTHLHSGHLAEEDSLHTRFTMGTTYIPTVLLLRNPAQAIPSYYKFIRNRSQPWKIPASAFKTEAFRKFVKKGVKLWMELALDRLLWTEAPLYVIHYEHLMENPIKEITALLAFLGVPRHDGRLACLSLHLEGKFKSRESKPLDPYTKEEKSAMMAATLAVNRTLLLLGYPPLPTYSY